MLPSAEEARETQFAAGALVAIVQVCATDGLVGREKQMKAAIIQERRRGAPGGWLRRLAREGSLRQAGGTKPVRRHAAGFGSSFVGRPAPANGRQRFVSHFLTATNVIRRSIAITPGARFRNGYPQPRTGAMHGQGGWFPGPVVVADPYRLRIASCSN